METETATLVKLDPPRSQGAIILGDALKQGAEQRALLVRFVKEQMVEGVDYGTIPGAPKPCLYKPGAEKLTELYRSNLDLKISKEVEDWEKGFFYYRFKARIISRDSGATLGVGFGSCNSRETKYRWRDGKPKCPGCAKETLFRSKDKPEWFCWAKKGGCGATFHITEERITKQPIGKIENPDVADLVNTILKMATKRAHVAAALQLAGCSDLFTQDLEDLPEYQASRPPVETPKPEPETKAAKPEAKTAVKETPKMAPATKPEVRGCDHQWDMKGLCGLCGQAEPKAPGQSPALRARGVQVWKKLSGVGWSQGQFQQWTQDVLGRSTKSAEWTEDDVSRLESAIVGELSAAEPGGAG